MFKDLQSLTWHQTIRENSCYCKQDGELALASSHMATILALTGELVGSDSRFGRQPDVSALKS